MGNNGCCQHSWRPAHLQKLGFGKYRQRTGGHDRRIWSMFGIGTLLSEDGMEFIRLASVRSSAISPQEILFLKAFFHCVLCNHKFLFMSHTA
jgi:hypothetical protein